MRQLSLFENYSELNVSKLNASKQLLLSSVVPATQLQTLTKIQVIFELGNTVNQLLKQNKTISFNKLFQIASAASTSCGSAWQGKDIYEAIEVGMLLYLRQEGESFCNKPADFVLHHLLEIQALLPTQTRRSQTQMLLQQFSTPVSLAFCAARAAQIKVRDYVLEPSAGTGLLAIWAELAGAKLILNEISPERREILDNLFPKVPISSHDAEQINDYLDFSLVPSVGIMNPPFSASVQVTKRNPFATLKHIKSALMRLQPGGRLVAITANWFNPNARFWQKFFQEQLGKFGTVIFSAGIEGKAYAKHGTNTETRLTVFDRVPQQACGTLIDECLNLTNLLEEVQRIPSRVDIPLSSYITKQSKQVDKPEQFVLLPLLLKEKNVTPSHAPKIADDLIELEYEAINCERVSQKFQSDLYEPYKLQTIKIAKASIHPTPLVQSVAMASVTAPIPTYRPLLPRHLIDKGILSDAQLETIVYAGNAHQQLLPSWFKVNEDRIEISTQEEPNALQFRRGYFIGDGTGVGKGRQACGVVLDRWLKGQKKVLWLSKSNTLLEDARRDWQSLGGNPNEIISLSKFEQGETITLSQGIIFSTYATLRTEAKQGKISRVEQLVNWLGKDFDGVVLLDECQALSNAISQQGERGEKKASLQGIAGLRLQRALPQARILYLSATGATCLPNLAYLDRLGLWHKGDTPFSDREEFISSVATGGIAALEVVARDLKALGVYTARSLSYEGVQYEVVEHQLTPAQVDIYDRYAHAYQIIHANIQKAMECTNIVSHSGITRNSNAKSAAYSTFESTKQRFFNHLLISMKCPTLIAAVEQDLKAGYAAVIQLISTDEALLDRRLAEIPVAQYDDIQVDITPREYLFDYLKKAFPVQLHRVWTDSEGTEHSAPAFDTEGNPIFCQEALQQRDELIESLALLPSIPSALDLLIHHFGTEKVSECTGRSKRIIRQLTDNDDRLVVQKRSSNANLAETQAFQDDRKQILVFSQAGGTGRSYHADLNAKNQRLRRHYLLEAGWRADEAIQGLGRTNRSNQKQPPVFVVISTDVKGEKRFISTIARRLDSLGALTRGQRQTGGHGLFKERDNLESDYAKAALQQLYTAIYRGQVEGFSLEKFAKLTGLKLTTKEGTFKEELPPITQFLNRCLAMPIAEQQQIFEELEVRIDKRIEEAIEAGTYEKGVETLQSEGFRVLERTVIYTHPTGAVSHAVKIEQKQKTQFVCANSAIAQVRLYNGQLCINDRSGSVAAITNTTSKIGRDGESIARVNLLRPLGNNKLTIRDFQHSSWKVTSEDEFVRAWNKEIASIPEFTYTNFYLVTGLLLPIWKKLDHTRMRVYRLQTDDGEQLLGRVLDSVAMAKFSSQFAIACSLTDEEVFHAVFKEKQKVNLTDRLSLVNRVVAGQPRLEIIGFEGQSEFNFLKSLGAFSEIIQWKARVFIPTELKIGLNVIKKIRAAL